MIHISISEIQLVLGNGNRDLFESEVSGVSGEFGEICEFGDVLGKGLKGVAELRCLEDCLWKLGRELIRSRYFSLFRQFDTLIHKCK